MSKPQEIASLGDRLSASWQAHRRRSWTDITALRHIASRFAVLGFVGVLTLGANSALADGYHDSSDCNTTAGWAWNPAQPNTPINVDLYADANLVATITAGTYRADLANAGIGNGYHAFNVPTPDAIKDGQYHTITVKYAGSQTNLTYSPKGLSGCTLPLQPPTTLVATAASISQIGLSWTDNSTNESGFKIERKKGASGTYAQIAVTAANAKSYADNYLDASTPYFYRVKATNAAGDSAYSNESSATTQPALIGGTSPGATMTWLYGYDAQGNPRADIDPNSKQTNRSFDRLNRATQIARPAPVGSSTPTTVGTTYDGQGNLTAVTDPRSLATTSAVDGLKNVKTLTSPDTGATNSTYDASGNLLTRTDSRGKVTTYAYDALNRLTSATYSSGVPTVFQYDGGTNPAPYSLGRLTKITDESGSTSYTYDAQGNVLTKAAQIAGQRTLSVVYTWGTSGSAAGSLTSVTYPSGSRVNYAYDTSGRISAITVNPVNANGVGTNTGGTINVLSGITYNADNAIKGWTWSDGTVYQRNFDSFGRLSSYPLGNPSGTGTAAGLLRTLSYDAAGQIVGYTHTRAGTAQAAFDQTFSYDDLGQLTTATQASTSYNYSYDASGNRTIRTVGATNYANTIDPASNRIMQAQGQGSSNGTVTFGYDNAGNMLADGTATYSYTDRGRLGSVSTASTGVAYRYNGLEQRVYKSPTGRTNPIFAYYAYDEAGQLLAEYGVDVTPLYETVYLGSTPVAVLKQSGSASVSTLQVASYNVYADHVDTPRVLTASSSQAIVWRWDTGEPFGATAPDQNPSGLGVFVFNQRFPGQLLDAETGNFYNWNRDYKPPLGRYAQSDPIGLKGGVNTYSYVSGNPLRYVDPRGLIKWAGEQYQFTAAGAVGGSLSWFDLKSQCIDGKYAYVRVFASAVVAGYGAEATGAGGHVEFNDSNIAIDPYVFQGTYRFFSAGLGAGPVASYSYTQLGQAFSTPDKAPSTSLGFDASLAASIYGRSAVTSVEIKSCTCEQK